ncbi:hypothetical protein HYALB_00009922 [Hymenoscyphus albidus]|uniref:Uncharacterized protein n=1 Tax=Hymenoscyphus albidus TaxID=595503 RepID=A0A9N9Q0K1_9HELO|nr:hypothetical protein HYALB_00009922 [Hymenoscyphus albidus]
MDVEVSPCQVDEGGNKATTPPPESEDATKTPNANKGSPKVHNSELMAAVKPRGTFFVVSWDVSAVLKAENSVDGNLLVLWKC